MTKYSHPYTTRQVHRHIPDHDGRSNTDSSRHPHWHCSHAHAYTQENAHTHAHAQAQADIHICRETLTPRTGPSDETASRRRSFRRVWPCVCDEAHPNVSDRDIDHCARHCFSETESSCSINEGSIHNDNVEEIPPACILVPAVISVRALGRRGIVTITVTVMATVTSVGVRARIGTLGLDDAEIQRDMSCALVRSPRIVPVL
ncbi:uncharacterized protein ATNIH1004_005896 [Aspergillus tanneri]|uniref:Uncharacterized protein n=1 Tax=Aspergillus tanneri TaxID=1220188 RepID=A0A5M9MMR5_9EURO|nr:uncharacterized protein ATNIH1004_005896 [Aspergillus tanneri]KAA8647206.1 hypothetical protein ATNIH1004_005896 [Aspergillus tanneri]